ncbi:MAG: ArsR/SmtB family transcription factor [Gemmatimonas sp.]
MGEYNSSQLDLVFSAVSDATRRAILAQLATGDARVTDIAAAFPISLNSVSKHVRMLERAGLVERTVLGREHVLSLNAGAMREADQWMSFYRQFWTERLAALDRMMQKRRRNSGTSTTTREQSNGAATDSGARTTTTSKTTPATIKRGKSS